MTARVVHIPAPASHATRLHDDLGPLAGLVLHQHPAPVVELPVDRSLPAPPSPRVRVVAPVADAWLERRRGRNRASAVTLTLWSIAATGVVPGGWWRSPVALSSRVADTTCASWPGVCDARWRPQVPTREPVVFMCTRGVGHTGRHAAGTGEEIVAVWRDEPAPLPGGAVLGVPVLPVAQVPVAIEAAR